MMTPARIAAASAVLAVLLVVTAKVAFAVALRADVGQEVLFIAATLVGVLTAVGAVAAIVVGWLAVATRRECAKVERLGQAMGITDERSTAR